MLSQLGARLAGAAMAAALAMSGAAQAADPGIDEANKTVTVGAFTPITGPVPFYAIVTHAADAYFRRLNENGGIDGWKVNYVAMDDGYDPARSVAVTRKARRPTKPSKSAKAKRMDSKTKRGNIKALRKKVFD